MAAIWTTETMLAEVRIESPFSLSKDLEATQHKNAQTGHSLGLVYGMGMRCQLILRATAAILRSSGSSIPNAAGSA